MRYSRYLKRMAIGWLILTPLCYFVVLPWLIHTMEVKIRLQNYTACVEMTKQPDVPTDAENEATSQQFCHCVIDGLTLDKQDLLDIAMKRPLVRLTSYVQEQANSCTEKALDAAKNKEPEVIYFNN